MITAPHSSAWTQFQYKIDLSVWLDWSTHVQTLENKIRSYMEHTQKHFCVLKANRIEQNHCWPSATSKLGFKGTKPYIRFMKWGINKLLLSLCHNVLFSQEGGNEKFCVNSRLQTTGCWLPKAWRSHWQWSLLLVTCHPHPEHWGFLAQCCSCARKHHTLCPGKCCWKSGWFLPGTSQGSQQVATNKGTMIQCFCWFFPMSIFSQSFYFIFV